MCSLRLHSLRSHSSNWLLIFIYVIFSNPQGITLNNANSYPLQVVPWNSHSALELSTLALLVTVKDEKCCHTKESLPHLIHDSPQHQLALWVVPPYCWCIHWSCGLHTVDCLNLSNGQCHVQCWARQDSPVILQDGSRHCSGKMRQQE